MTTNTAKKITAVDEKKAKSMALSAKLKALIEKNKAADKAEAPKKGPKKVDVVEHALQSAKKDEKGKVLDLKAKLKAKAASKPQPRTSILKDKKERAKCHAVGVDAVIGSEDSEGMFATVIGNGAAELFWEDRADAIACALDVAEHIRTVAKKMAERDAD
jgi:spore germination cell wall hydrolase CwlJ-like protein